MAVAYFFCVDAADPTLPDVAYLFSFHCMRCRGTISPSLSTTPSYLLPPAAAGSSPCLSVRGSLVGRGGRVWAGRSHDGNTCWRTWYFDCAYLMRWPPILIQRPPVTYTPATYTWRYITHSTTLTGMPGTLRRPCTRTRPGTGRTRKPDHSRHGRAAAAVILGGRTALPPAFAATVCTRYGIAAVRDGRVWYLARFMTGWHAFCTLIP